jgi:integrase
MALTDAKIRGIKPPARQVKHFDGGGLYLLCTPSGGRLWRLKYRFDGKSKGLSLGKYPDVSLLDARQRRDEARRHLANKVDPGAVKRAQREAQTAETDTFEVISAEWFNKFSATWSEKYRSIVSRRLEVDINPYIGKRPIADIKAPELLTVLRRAEDRGCIDTAHRLRSITGLVFRYAVATGRAERDPSGDLRGALPPAPVQHHAAITNPKEVAPLLRALDGYQGSFVVQSALRLLPLFFVRPGELRHAEWAEIDFDQSLWSIPAERMKMRQAHLVPLCSQAITILTTLKALTGAGRYCFPSMRTSKKPMSDNTLGAALQTLGYTPDVQSAHGFRAMARTILDEVLSIRPDFIEHQLAHAVRDPLGQAYNRTSHLAERKAMMQTWADYLDELKAGAKVLPMQRKV